MTIDIDDRNEWLEADGLGGFASGTVSGIRTRRYHALLLSATTPPTGRVVLVNGMDVFASTGAGRFALSSQRYAPDVIHPDGAGRIAGFTADPWPTWEYELPDGTRLRQEICVERGVGRTILVWTMVAGNAPVLLEARPFLSGRDYHSMHHENAAFSFDAEVRDAVVTWRPYDGLPAVHVMSDGRYAAGGDWYRQFLYTAERARGLDDTEDLASPGAIGWTLDGTGATACMLLAASRDPAATATRDDVKREAATAREAERRRREALPTALDRAADSYLVRRGRGRTIVAGYPWFTDWGRDTFIAVRGVCLAAERFDEARDILVEWADSVSEGMLPNRFADQGEAPEYNSVDASLWYVVAVAELIEMTKGRGVVDERTRARLQDAVLRIVEGYAAGTRFGIRLDADGLLAAGVPGVQLTWMDAKVGDWVVTPRVGKPVEVQALWLNALSIASRLDARWAEPLARGRQAFLERFWNEERGSLADVVDVDHVSGTRDDAVRPNQILAVGGLPVAVLDGARAARVVDTVERRLVTPLGLRSLAPGEPGYAGRYEGNGLQRDSVYHQGTVWPWLMGPFVDAWVRVRGGTAAARRQAREQFVMPLLAHLGEAGVGHVSEIADGDSPFTPRGCPFQAWSVGELLRLDRVIAPATARRTPVANKKRAAVAGKPLAARAR
jgi:predicted glycogen debranching enzyme